MMQYSMELALEKKGLLPKDLDLYLAGDLLNQIISANFTARLQIPLGSLWGLFHDSPRVMSRGILLDGGFAERIGVWPVATMIPLKDSFVLQLNWVTSGP